MSRGRGAPGCGLHRTVPGHATGWSETRWSRPRPPMECAKADVLRGRPLGSSRLRHSATYRRGQNTPLLCPPCPSVELTLHEPSGCLLVFSFHFFVVRRQSGHRRADRLGGPATMSAIAEGFGDKEPPPYEASIRDFGVFDRGSVLRRWLG